MDLHCVICYEEFDLHERYPVVLPCGHTYVCVVCSKKIEICHECREPLYWTPPKPQPTITNHNNNIHRSPATSRYSRYNSRYSPSTPPHNSVVKPEKREKIPLPCPKNVVLMESIEAKQRQERLVAEQKAAKLLRKQERLRERQLKAQQRRQEKEGLRLLRDAEIGRGLVRQHSSDSQSIEVDLEECSSLLDATGDDEEELDYDDDISSSSSSALPLGDPQLINGYAALSGACGTYAVREPEGLVVLPLDPNRPKYHVMKNHDDEKKDGSQHSSTHFSSIFNKSGEDNGAANDDIGNIPSSGSAREPFSIAEGQKLQVVGVMESNEHGVYQLARGAGFVVATAKQLVKVGGPLESSCKMEGMLQSILDKQQEMERKLNEMKNLADGLKRKILLEQDKPAEVPVISIPIPKKISTEQELSSSSNHDSNNATAVSIQANLGTGQPPKTPTRPTSTIPRSPVGGSAGRDSVSTVNSTVVELGMSPRTPSQRTGNYYMGEQGEFYHSPANSCPIPSRTTAVHLDQPFLDDEAPASTGVLRYRVNSDDETSGLGWAGVLGCGTSLFGERLLDSSDPGTANNIFNTATNRNSDILRMSQNAALMQQTNAERRAAALAAVAVGSSGIGLLESSGSADSPLRRAGSFDGGGGVNFRTGMSGHSGLGKPKRDFSCDQQVNYQSADNGILQPRRRMLMSEMSQHRGAAPVRLGPRAASSQRRGTAPDTLVGCQTIR
mmetsp:Transcript_15287/g.38527  ORF Transcript_15287/g.38527 Transcript_15287/m.38527 type:complete len:726 (-) Transcript_15287:77-2254(-)